MSNELRRKLLKSITFGSGALVAGKSLPENWTKPVVNSVLLPTHAQTTDTGSLTAFTPLDYFGEDLPRNRPSAMLDTNKQNLFADALDVIVPEAHANGVDPLPGMSVASDGDNAIVRFLSSKAHRLYQASVPLDGTPSGVPTLVDSCGSKTQSELPVKIDGPQSVQILGYTEGAQTVKVRVNSACSLSPSEGDSIESCYEGWEVDVPKAIINNLNLDCKPG